MNQLFFSALLTFVLIWWPDFPGWKKSAEFIKQVTTVVDNTPPVAPTSFQFDSLGTDSTELIVAGYPDEGSTGYIGLYFSTNLMTVASDSSLADSTFRASDSINTAHWAHGQTEYGTVFYMLVQRDASDNETVSTGYYILDHLTDYGDQFVIQIIGSTFTMPIYSGGTYSARVDWGDGDIDSVTAYNDADRVHTYASADTYKIAVSGTLYGWAFANTGSRHKLYTIDNWGSGTFRIGDYAQYFYGCDSLISINTADTLDLTGTTSMDDMFHSCSLLVSVDSIKYWSTGSITSTHNMFQGCVSITSMDISGWDMSSLTDPGGMFWGCTALTDVGDLSSWTTSSVTTTQNMFRTCTNLDSVWCYGWDVTNLENASSMWQGATMVTDEYDSLLANWGAQSLQSSVLFHAGLSTQYSKAFQSWRDTLTTTYSWTITDGGCSDCISSAPTFVTVDTFGTGADSTYATANTWCSNTTAFWVAWDDTLITAIADSSNADSLAYHAAADSSNTFKWAHGFGAGNNKAYVTIIATDGYNYEIVYDSCNVNLEAIAGTLNRKLNTILY